jgi:hypothetical protein
MKIQRTHLKALLANPEIREAMLGCLDNEDLLSADIDSLAAPDFDTLCNAAWEAFGDVNPVVKTYSARGGDGEDYPIQIVGVPGAYIVSALEFDDEGMFGTLAEAQDYIALNWLGEATEDTSVDS